MIRAHLGGGGGGLGPRGFRGEAELPYPNGTVRESDSDDTVSAIEMVESRRSGSGRYSGVGRGGSAGGSTLSVSYLSGGGGAGLRVGRTGGRS